MSDTIGWIVEARIRDGQRPAFAAVMAEIVAASEREDGTLAYQYYVSDDGDVLVYERFRDVAAAHAHIDTWDRYAARWTAAAEPVRMVHLGTLPDDLRARHAALDPLWLKPFGGFAR